MKPDWRYSSRFMWCMSYIQGVVPCSSAQAKHTLWPSGWFKVKSNLMRVCGDQWGVCVQIGIIIHYILYTCTLLIGLASMLSPSDLYVYSCYLSTLDSFILLSVSLSVSLSLSTKPLWLVLCERESVWVSVHVFLLPIVLFRMLTLEIICPNLYNTAVD